MSNLINYLKTKNKYLKLIIAILTIVVIVLVLISKLGSEIYETFIGFDFSIIGFVILFYFVALGFATLNWFVIIDRFANNINWKQHARIYLITLAARRLPGTIWYVGGRIALYKRLNISAALISIASGIELIVGIITSLFLSLFILPLGLNLPKNSIYYFIFLFVFLLFFLQPKLIICFLKKIDRPINSTITYWDTIKWFLSNLSLKITSGFMVAIIAIGFLRLNFNEFMMVIGAWSLSSAASSLAIFLPSNFGITELTFSGLLTTIMPLAVSISIAIAVRIFTTLFELLISAIVFLFISDRGNSD